MDAKPLSTKQENPFLSLVANIALPIFILDKFSGAWGPDGPKLALILAVSIQVAYALYDYSQRKKISPIFLLGFINVLLTGTLGLLALEGIWFAIKEASFPLLIGIFVFASSFTKKPLIEMLISNPQVMKRDLLNQRLSERGTDKEFHKHLQLSTRLFSLSFVLSALLNFWLARKIFIEIDPALDEYSRQIILNEQISSMTWQGFVVIMLPSMLCLAGVFWHVFYGVKKFSGLGPNELIEGSQKS